MILASDWAIQETLQQVKPLVCMARYCRLMYLMAFLYSVYAQTDGVYKRAVHDIETIDGFITACL
jgi:hypothetical protein